MTDPLEAEARAIERMRAFLWSEDTPGRKPTLYEEDFRTMWGIANRALAARSARPGWEPIETAPRDTLPPTRVDIWAADRRWADCWLDHGEWRRVHNLPVPANPTHWMHRPAAPQTDGEGQ